jgi:hypothetical protein
MKRTVPVATWKWGSSFVRPVGRSCDVKCELICAELIDGRQPTEGRSTVDVMRRNTGVAKTRSHTVGAHCHVTLESLKISLKLHGLASYRNLEGVRIGGQAQPTYMRIRLLRLSM